MVRTKGPGVETRSEMEVPARVKSTWRDMLHVTREVIDTPASRITRSRPQALEVFVKSERDSTVYEEGERAPLGSRDYCETVIETKKRLVVEDGRGSEWWAGNVDVERGMVSYMGLPLFWPDGQVFGTICVLDKRARGYTETHEALLEQLQRSAEKDLMHLDEERRFRSELSRRQRIERSLRETEQAMHAASRQLQMNDEQDRSAVSGQLHDEIMQGLTAIKMDLSACTSKLPVDTIATIQPSLASILDTLDSLVVRVRQLSSTLVSPVLQDLGLPSAIERELEEFGHRTGIPASATRLDDPVAVQPFVNVVMHRTLQRVLTHVAGFPGIRSVELELRRTEKRLTMTVSARGLSTAHDDREVQTEYG
ncbi:MAG: GAF domain-containing sensor histidine kinase, partial [Chloroflexota bacterium]